MVDSKGGLLTSVQITQGDDTEKTIKSILDPTLKPVRDHTTRLIRALDDLSLEAAAGPAEPRKLQKQEEVVGKVMDDGLVKEPNEGAQQQMRQEMRQEIKKDQGPLKT